MVDGQPREPVSFLVFSASLREGSLNTRLAELAVGAIESNGGTVDFGSMAEFDCPSYNADVQRERGFPAAAEELRRRLEAIRRVRDLLSRVQRLDAGRAQERRRLGLALPPQPFHERTGCCCRRRLRWSAATAALWALRVPFEHLGARIYPDMFSLARAHRPSMADERIADEELRRALREEDRRLHGARRGGQALPVHQEARGSYAQESLPSRRGRSLASEFKAEFLTRDRSERCQTGLLFRPFRRSTRRRRTSDSVASCGAPVPEPRAS